MAKGRFAYTPMSMVPKKAARMVATMEGALGIPAASRMAGFTMIMYAMVRKVVAPAIVSVFQLVPSSSNLKNSRAFIPISLLC